MSDFINSAVRIREATEILATGTGTVKERLLLAVSRRLVFAEASALPEDLQALLNSINDRLLKKEPTYRGQSRLEATLYKMHQSTAAKIAKDIWRLNLSVTERRFRPDWPIERPATRSIRKRATKAHAG